MSLAGPRRVARDILVIFHLCLITVLSFPAPLGARSEANWRDDILGQQMLAWTAPFHAVGIDISKDELTTLLRGAAENLLDVRDVLVVPFKPYVSLFGTGQGWHMFGSVNTDPGRLQVELREGETWRTIYLARDPVLTWRAEQFDQERLRAVTNPWSWGLSKGTFKQFAAWLAIQAHDDFPQATAMRASILVGHLPSPAQLSAGKIPPEKARWTQTIALERSP